MKSLLSALLFSGSLLAAGVENPGAEILARAASTGDIKTLQNLLSLSG